MLIGYGQPTTSPSVDGAQVINLAALSDGRPASLARISGGDGNARLRLTWDAPNPIRMVAALGLTCPVGTALTLTGKRQGDAGFAYALGANAATQTVVDLVDGSRAAWFVLPADNAPLVGLQLQVEAGAFDIGELVALQGVEVPHEPGAALDRIDPSVAERTLGGGINVVSRRTYRRVRARPTADYLAAAKRDGLANGMDWERLVFAMRASARLAVATRWEDVEELQRTALYGRALPSAITHRAGNLFGTDDWTFEEIPPV